MFFNGAGTQDATVPTSFGLLCAVETSLPATDAATTLPVAATVDQPAHSSSAASSSPSSSVELPAIVATTVATEAPPVTTTAEPATPAPTTAAPTLEPATPAPTTNAPASPTSTQPTQPETVPDFVRMTAGRCAPGQVPVETPEECVAAVRETK